MTDIIYNIIVQIGKLEESQKFLAIPCYFLLQIKEFFNVYKLFPGGEKSFSECFLETIFKQKREQKESGQTDNSFKSFLNQNNVPLYKNYSDYNGMP
jgi:hypothetical protein